MTLRFYDREDGVKVFLLFYPKPFPKTPGEAQHYPIGLPSQHFSYQHCIFGPIDLNPPKHNLCTMLSFGSSVPFLPTPSLCLVPIAAPPKEGSPSARDTYRAHSPKKRRSPSSHPPCPAPGLRGMQKGRGGAEKKAPPSPRLVRNDITSRL